jgi:7-keto-8-aminopelargonate synthetase-like enzyme
MEPDTMTVFKDECFKRGIAVVVVSYPATSLFESRARLCVS